MLISEFARTVGLSLDTVRFYIRRGLLTPELSGKGGRNPYQKFSQDDVATARFIRLSQSLGMSLNEVGAINEERLRGEITSERGLEIMSWQLAQLEQKMTELSVMADYLKAKIAWYDGGQLGPAPQFPAMAL